MSIDSTFLQARIDATKTQIVAFEAAVLAIGTGGIEEYLIDTGQTRQRVTKLDLSLLQKTIDSLYNRLATLCARRDGTGVVTVRPSW